MKQINFPFVSSTVSNRNLIQVKIIDFNADTDEDSNYVNVSIKIKDYTDTILEFNFQVERSIAEEYHYCFMAQQPISIITEKTNYLVFTPNISISE